MAQDRGAGERRHRRASALEGETGACLGIGSDRAQPDITLAALASRLLAERGVKADTGKRLVASSASYPRTPYSPDLNPIKQVCAKLKA